MGAEIRIIRKTGDTAYSSEEQVAQLEEYIQKFMDDGWTLCPRLLRQLP